MASALNPTQLLSKLAALRQELHSRPEQSNSEEATAARICALLAAHHPDQIISGLGGHGLAFVFDGAEPGPCVAFRCELDALPIHETNTFAYRSQHAGVAHKCGHDGHMAIVVGLGLRAAAKRPRRGRLVLLFQPAEETGEGATRMALEPAFQTLGIETLFALHNLPEYPLGTVVVRSGPFTCASVGLTVRLRGKTAHAAHPEDGISPALPMCAIIAGLKQLPARVSGFCRVTVVGAKLGEAAFGTAPGEAQVMATLRAEADSDLEQVKAGALDLIAIEAEKGGLTHKISYCDAFPAGTNHPQAVQHICRAAKALNAPLHHLEAPLRFSEDFGCLTRGIRGAMFGLGSGPGPGLHNPDYDFPDALIGPGLDLFQRLADQLLAGV